MSESHLVQSILREFGSDPRWRLWRANCGAARAPNGQVVRFGVPGQADIGGIMLPGGRMIQVECKAGRRQQSEAQRNWQAMIEKFGGAYCVVRDINDAQEFFRRIRLDG